MPPPSLSTTTTRRSTPRRRRAVSAPASWTKAMSPSSTTTVRPDRARPSAVDIVPSMPLAPRLAWARAAGPPYHSRSRTGIDEATTSSASAGSTCAIVRATAGSVSAGCCPKHPLDVRLGRGAGVDPLAEPSSSPAGSPLRSAARRGEAATLPSGSIVPGPPTCTTGAPLADDPLAEHLRRRWPSDADDHVRAMRGGEGGVAQHRRRTPRRRRRSIGSPTCGSASTGHPDRAESSATASAVMPLRPPATMMPRPCSSAAAPASSAVDAGRGAASSGRHRRPPPPEGAAPTGPSSGSRNGRFRCTGPLAAAARLRAASGAPRAVIGSRRATPGSWNHRTELPEQVGLVDRLRGADADAARGDGRR